jgi:hypothetical protein
MRMRSSSGHPTPKVPLAYRVLFAFLDREGVRAGEAQRLRWGDLDLDRGAIALDENKTDDPRSWALDSGVSRALCAWRDMRDDASPSDHVFIDQYGRPIEVDGLAEKFRSFLKAAGVSRSALHDAGPNRRPIRVHDLRATFVTLWLANGKTEAWVMDRTGHTTSQMLNRYRRAARSIAELGQGALAPLDEAIPELRPAKPKAAGGGGGLPHDYPMNSGPAGTRTRDLRIKSPQLYRLSYQPKVVELVTRFVALSSTFLVFWPTLWPRGGDFGDRYELRNGFVERGQFTKAELFSRSGGAAIAIDHRACRMARSILHPSFGPPLGKRVGDEGAP